ncbi:MAG TPA: phage tail protein [Streptosporangiaceae bacterium]
MSDGQDALVALLPAHLLARDDDSVLRALLAAVAGELGILQDDLDSLYDAWFVETCPEWAVPYLADLVGVSDLPADLGPGAGSAATRRTLVANTVAYRRRKGTAAVLEQVTRDVTGWPAKAVEFYRLLAASAHLNHVRVDRPAAASLRGAATVELTAPELASGCLDTLAHTGEVRRIGSGRGRYGIPNIAVFAFPTQVFPVGTAPAAGAGPLGSGWSQARPAGAGFTADPAGRRTPLFAVPRGEEQIEQLAGEENLPVPLRPRRLLGLLQAARRGELAAEELPLGVWLDGDAEPVPPARLLVCGLEDLAPGETSVQVMADPVGGRLTVHRDGATSRPARVFVRYAYGAAATIGAGTYQRSAVLEQVLAADPFSGDPAVRGEAGVRQDPDRAPGEAETVAAGLLRAEQAWRGAPADGGFGSYVVEVADNASYPGDLAVAIPAATRLILAAAEGARPHVLGSVSVTGGRGSSLVLDGLIVEGDVVVRPGALGSLAVSQCTLTGRLLLGGSEAGPNGELQLAVVRSQLTGVAAAVTVPLVACTDTVVDAATPAAAVRGPGAHLSLEGCTVRGPVETRSLDASSCVLDGTVTVADRQVGCVRYSYLGPQSRTPRRYRCVPDPHPGQRNGAASQVVPVYASDQPGSPGYLELAATCPAEIASGGELEAEMGAHHHLRRPVRLAAALRQLQQYVPVGLETGIFRS